MRKRVTREILNHLYQLKGRIEQKIIRLEIYLATDKAVGIDHSHNDDDGDGPRIGSSHCALECAVVEELEEDKQIVCTALGLAEQEKEDCLSGGGSG